ncbi:hypothetical protein E2C01_008944 [Portunus trituberculatus]|uniref:Uncharacterized protein n=1 Tax=Portunus trituberculatus TaxID=210409 RepID=A0A5B7D5M9_PORTR|nr:hypothetical protein [Portunus trituberculatus]
MYDDLDEDKWNGDKKEGKCSMFGGDGINYPMSTVLSNLNVTFQHHTKTTVPQHLYSGETEKFEEEKAASEKSCGCSSQVDLPRTRDDIDSCERMAKEVVNDIASNGQLLDTTIKATGVCASCHHVLLSRTLRHLRSLTIQGEDTLLPSPLHLQTVELTIINSGPGANESWASSKLITELHISTFD